jgi:hypothetical protein
MSAITEPIPFRLLIDEAVKWTRRHFRAMYVPVAVPISIANGLIPVAQALWFGGMMSAEESPDPGRMMLGAGAFFVVALLAAVVWGLGYAALLQAATDALQGQATSMTRAWLFTIRPPVLGTNVLAGLCVVVGCVFCFFPGLFLGLLFSMVVPVMAAEGLFGMDAVTRSAQLVRYNPAGGIGSSPLLKVFLLFFLGYLLSAAVGMAVQLPFIVAQQILIFRAAAEGSSDPSQVMSTAVWLQVPGNMLNALVTTAVQVYMSFALVLFYFDLRRRQEGGDLAAAIREMRGPEGAPPTVTG